MKPVCTLWDIENIVCMSIKKHQKSLVEFDKIAKGFRRFLRIEGYRIHETSAISVKPINCLESAVTEVGKDYGLQFIQAMAWEAAEEALIRHVEELLEQDPFPLPKIIMILSGDGRFVSLVNRLKSRKIRVGVAAWRRHTHSDLKRAANKFIALEDILHKMGVEFAHPKD